MSFCFQYFNGGDGRKRNSENYRNTRALLRSILWLYWGQNQVPNILGRLAKSILSTHYTVFPTQHVNFQSNIINSKRMSLPCTSWTCQMTTFQLNKCLNWKSLQATEFPYPWNFFSVAFILLDAFYLIWFRLFSFG